MTDVDDLIQSVEDKLGKGVAYVIGQQTDAKLDVCSTGILPLDIALGCGGYPRGRVIEIFGPEASGKTTLALHAVASVQAAGGIAGFVDAEHALDPFYAEALGVDLNSMVFIQPNSGEEGLEAVEALARGGSDIIIVDSVAALTPQAEIDGDMGSPHMALHARLMSQAMRKLTAIVSKSNVILVFINQTRSKIGVMFGSKTTTTGGNALKFYASVRLDIRRIATLKTKESAFGSRTKVRVVKNKVAPPFSETEFDIIWGLGVDSVYALIDVGLEFGVLKRKGSWFSFNDKQIGQGRNKTREAINKDSDLRKSIETEIRELTIGGSCATTTS